MIRSQSRRYIAISNYVVFAIVALRAVLTYGSHAVLAPLLMLMAIFLLLLVGAPHITQRWAAFRWIYFGVQTALVVVMGFIVPSFDFLWVLFLILAGQAYIDLPRRAAFAWMYLLIAIAGLSLMTTMGIALGLAILLNLIAGGYFMISFGTASWQAEVARSESAALLHDLQTAHTQLQDYAAQAEELSVVRERNRVARELHDSVNQSIFSITLTAEAARTMLDRDPARLPPYLRQLQDMTGSALAQLRSLIGQLRPKSNEPPAN
jgi:signal transduction histidine kinase